MEKKIQLPKLRKVDVNRPKKKKILLLSDDLRLQSGIAVMSKQLVISTAHHYDWVQLGAALKHPDHGKIFDMSAPIEEELGIDNVYVKVYAHTGYGTPEVVRELLTYEKPDALMLFTDPRHWFWFWPMEYEIHTKWKIPILYWSIWDNYVYPDHNGAFYGSCDLLMGISRQTNVIHRGALRDQNVDIEEITF